ncbi:hypothetical protein JXJ21_15920, partial [candidate division KSB1 bacterium]|nr:hypothetical protein [candidate division KSB1 bacterium]
LAIPAPSGWGAVLWYLIPVSVVVGIVFIGLFAIRDHGGENVPVWRWGITASALATLFMSTGSALWFLIAGASKGTPPLWFIALNTVLFAASWVSINTVLTKEMRLTVSAFWIVKDIEGKQGAARSQ